MLSIELYVKGFCTHKEAESPEDCQDAYCFGPEKARYAVADGATQSFYPAQWAKLLVERFCKEKDTLNTDILSSGEWSRWLELVQRRWYEEIQREVENHQAYYNKNRFIGKESAAATFAGIEFKNDSSDKKRLFWNAMIIGDSCLFKINEHDFESYLLKHSSDFTNQPDYFASFEKDNKYEPFFSSLGTTKRGDVFLLATDALAKWILREREAGQDNLKKIWNTISTIQNEKDFERFIGNIRQDEQISLDNDDSTLVIISVGEKIIKKTSDYSSSFLDVMPNFSKKISKKSESLTKSFSFDKWIQKSSVIASTNKVPTEGKHGEAKPPSKPKNQNDDLLKEKEAYDQEESKKLNIVAGKKKVEREASQHKNILIGVLCFLLILSCGINAFLSRNIGMLAVVLPKKAVPQKKSVSIPFSAIPFSEQQCQESHFSVPDTFNQKEALMMTFAVPTSLDNTPAQTEDSEKPVAAFKDMPDQSAASGTKLNQSQSVSQIISLTPQTIIYTKKDKRISVAKIMKESEFSVIGSVIQDTPDTGSQEWIQIKKDVWLAGKVSGVESVAIIDGSQVKIMSEKLHIRENMGENDSPIIGEYMKNQKFEKIENHLINGIPWYNIRLTGWVLKNN
jgi:hypothetical protein